MGTNASAYRTVAPPAWLETIRTEALVVAILILSFVIVDWTSLIAWMKTPFSHQ
jgi:hypothetical protein